MDLFEKYKIRIINNKRYYDFGFTKKIYNYELSNTTPYLFKYKDLTVQTCEWSKLALKIVSYLYEINPKSDEELLSLKYDFSKAVVFSKEPRTNFVPFKHLYLNVNHSSGHSYRSIQLIMSFFGVDLSECYFLIRRHIISEPEEVKNYLTEITKEQYIKFLKFKGVSDDKIPMLIRNVESLNSYLESKKVGYNNFFLFDDYGYFTSYKIRTFEQISKKHSSNEKLLNSCKITFKYLDMFYKNRPIIEKINNENMMEFREKLVQETDSLFDSLNTNVITSHKLFNVMRTKYSDEMKILGELNNKNDFFKVCVTLLDKKYTCTRPFISKAKNISLSHYELMLRYAYSEEKITTKMLTSYAKEMHFAGIDNLLKFFIDLSDQYIQTNVNTLIDKDILDISDDFLSELKKDLLLYINNIGPINTENYDGYNLLPSIDLEWNKYLLVGIIRTLLCEDFKIEYTSNLHKKTDFIISKS